LLLLLLLMEEFAVLDALALEDELLDDELLLLLGESRALSVEDMTFLYLLIKPRKITKLILYLIELNTYDLVLR
jgi:hypothetical protein